MAVACFVSGCAIYGDGAVVTNNQGAAREQFAQDQTCPIARVSAAHVSPAAPPPDIASDPERVRMWNDRAEDEASRQFTVSGCGRTTRYTCSGGNGDWSCGAY